MRLSERALTTHRDVKELLSVVQHADPDGDKSPRGHGGGSVPRVQRTDAKSLRGSKTMSCSHWLWVWLCHAELLMLTAQPAQKQREEGQETHVRAVILCS